MSAEDVFIEAAKHLKLRRLMDGQGRSRLVEPYMVYQSSRGKRLLHCYQPEGYSEAGVATGWKNPEAGAFTTALMSEHNSVQRPEYNPFNQRMFPVVYFSLPTRDGCQR